VYAGKDPEKAKQLLSELKGDADEALDTLRDLARGIYPPLLADQGLKSALSVQARKATVPVDLRADGIGRYSQDIEAAVYFCCLEALQNVQKYAGASAVLVGLREVDGSLMFDVEDDGKGFDVATQKRGSGNQNMADRVEALDGTLTIASSVGAGTTVTGTIPVGAAVMVGPMS
jgi:signal transduction histidine kinase